ncbi:MAG: PD-(D/E)XK nuclease family protein [Deltaproteobacteria bacterium]|nr:PD-(D/E)XK nuclease family protein [Deltaproteobacteria bacterium]
MDYKLLLRHFLENERVAFLVPNASVKHILIQDLLNSSESKGLGGRRIFSFNDFLLQEPLSSLEDSFALEEAVSQTLKHSAFKNMAFYEFAGRTLKTLMRADIDMTTLERAKASPLLSGLYKTYQKELQKRGTTKIQVFKNGIENFSCIQKRFFEGIDEVIGVGVNASHYLEKRFLIELQKAGMIYHDFTEMLLGGDSPEVTTWIGKNRIEEVKKIYELAKKHHEENPQYNQTFIFKNLYLYRDLLRDYFQGSFHFHPPQDLLKTPFCIFLFSLLENVLRRDEKERKNEYQSSYVHPLITFDLFEKILDAFPGEASFLEYFSRLENLFEVFKIEAQMFGSPSQTHLKRDLKALKEIKDLFNNINKLSYSSKVVNFDHFIAFLKLLISHRSYSENRKNKAAFEAYEFRNITFWRGDIQYLVGFHDDVATGDNPLLSESVVIKLNELCGEKRIFENKERILQEERIVLSNLKLGAHNIYVLRPHSSENKLMFTPSYIENLPQKPLKDSKDFFIVDQNEAYKKLAELDYEKSPLSLSLHKSLKNLNQERWYLYRRNLMTNLSLSTCEELAYPSVQKNVQKEFSRAYSSSHLEAYARCGYRYFLENALKMREKEEGEFELTPLEKGSVYHTSLFRFYSLRKKKGKTKIDRFDIENAKKQMEWAVHSSFEDYKKAHLWKLEKDRVLQVLLKFCEKEALDNWIPSYFEASFRMPLGIQDFFGDEIILRGMIDRIDVQEDKFLVIDYKTGSTLPPLAGILRGENFQLPIYRMAAEKFFTKDAKEGEATFYQLSSLEKKLKLSQKKYKKLETIVLDFIKKHVSAIRKGQFYRRFQFCTYCKLSPVCRLEKAQLKTP